MAGNEQWPVTAATWAWERRKEIGEALSGVWSWFRGEKDGPGERPGILILGPGGAGKSTLGKLLSGEYDLLLDPPGQYKESIGIEEYALQDDPRTEVVVPPGQQHRREATWTDLCAGIAAGRFRGIILLNAYGYHTLGAISYRDTAVYSKSGDEEFLAAYLKDRRNDELKVLRRVADSIRLGQGKLWMLSLVSKQDLWWPDRADVLAHYRGGDYGKVVREILGQRGQGQFRHELHFTSLVISNFTTGMGERLKANAEGYDQPLQVGSLRRLFETVAALKEWEADR